MALGQNSREVLLRLWEKSTESNLRGWVINARLVAWLALKENKNKLELIIFFKSYLECYKCTLAYYKKS